MKVTRKSLFVFIIVIVSALAGYQYRVYSEGGATPTIDPDVGVYDFPWLNATTGVNAPEFYLNSEDKTDLFEYPEQAASYIIFIEESLYLAKGGNTGQIVYGGATNVGGIDGTNASAVIQATIDALPEGVGGTIYLKEGTYFLTATISLKERTWIVGAGSQVTNLYLANNVNANMVEWTPSSNAFFVGLKGMRLYGNAAQQTNGHCFYANGNTHDGRLIDIFFDNAKNEGAYIENIWGWRIRGCLFEHCGGQGLKINGEEGYISGGFFADNTNGLWLEAGAQRNRFVNCYFYRNAVHGVYINNGDYNIFSACTWYENSFNLANTGDGMYIEGAANYNVIVGCYIDGVNQQRYGINLIGNYNTIIGTTFQNDVSGEVADVGTGSIINHNKGYVTEKSGTQTLTNGNTSVNVTHGCDYTPSAGDIQLHPIESLGSASYWWVEQITSTTFEINVNANPTQDVDFAWSVDRH